MQPTVGKSARSTPTTTPAGEAMIRTKLRPGDRVRVIAPRSDHHHRVGTIERVTDQEWAPAVVTIRLEIGDKIIVGTRALVLVAS